MDLHEDTSSARNTGGAEGQNSTGAMQPALAWRASVWLFAGVLAVAAVYVFAVSMHSLDDIRRLVLSVIPPGYEPRVTPQFCRKLVVGLRLLSATSLLAGLLLA